MPRWRVFNRNPDGTRGEEVQPKPVRKSAVDPDLTRRIAENSKRADMPEGHTFRIGKRKGRHKKGKK